MGILLWLLCYFNVNSIGVAFESPFNDAQVKDPTTSPGPPLSASEFSRARRARPRFPDPSVHRRPPLDGLPHFRNYLSYTFTRWPNGRVPYTIDRAFDDEQRIVIAKAIQHIEDAACVRFQPKTGSDQDFVHIYGDEKESCWADDHYQRKKGQHSVHLHRKYCVFQNVVAHELLHLLGVGHEQQRPDRDRYIAVNWTNIHIDHAFNFFKDLWDTGVVPDRPGSNCPNWRDTSSSPSKSSDPSRFEDCNSGIVRRDLGFGYDYKSIMHYEANFFAVDSRYDTLIPLDPGVGRGLGGPVMTAGDVDKLRTAYGCKGREYGGCGGSLVGEGGELRSSGDDLDDEGCEWLLTVEDGARVKIDFEEFQVPCDSGRVTLYAGFRQLGQQRGSFCTPGRAPPRSFTVEGNSATVHLERRRAGGGAIAFRAKWRKVSVTCCRAVKLSVGLGSPAFWKLRSYTGTYRRVGQLNGAPYYRLQGNYNVWLSRTLPLSSFSLAAWAVGHDLSGPPGQVGPAEPKFFLGGNSKCPRLLDGGIFYRERKDAAFVTEKRVTVECV